MDNRLEGTMNRIDQEIRQCDEKVKKLTDRKKELEIQKGALILSEIDEAGISAGDLLKLLKQSEREMKELLKERNAGVREEAQATGMEQEGVYEDREEV